jgi:hypothetical protein
MVQPINDIRELIAIPLGNELSLRTFAVEHSEERNRVERVIEFRRLVRQEFEQLCRAASS